LKFFSLTQEGSLAAARHILPLLWAKRQFASVIDIGCGVGGWLLAARKLGATALKGIDGPHIPDHLLVVEPDCIVRADLTQPLPRDRTFDLCLCLEAAEHLPPERGASLIEDLTDLSSIVLFSAAIPFQGGNGHFNEIWPEYWAKLFANRHYLPWTGLRELIWNERTVPWWYRQNLIVFVRASEWDTFLPGQAPANPGLLTAIHPESYLWGVRREKGRLATSFEFDLDTYYACARGENLAPTAYGPEFSPAAPES
jgi:SAM-dependent methyltransferase